MRWLALCLLGVACGDVPKEARWFWDRGAAAKTWEPCLRTAVAMRQACGDDQACADGVTDRFSYYCYWAKYDHAAPAPSSSPADGSLDPLTVSPCFWDQEHGLPAAPESERPVWIERTCERFALPVDPCRAELQRVTTNHCAGDFALTGAGP